jgi:hypothetical protein
MYTIFQNFDGDLVISIRISHFQFINNIYNFISCDRTISNGRKIALKISDKYLLEVLLLSIELQLFDILLIIVSATDKKYLLKDSGILFELVHTLSEVSK